MKVLKTVKYAVAGSLLLTSFNAFAGTTLIKHVADWSLYERDGNLCFITTDNKKYGGDDGFPNNESEISISISKHKNNRDMPVEVMVMFATNNNNSSGAIASASGVNSIALSDLDGGRSNFWAITKNLSNFIEQIKRKTLIIKGVGGRRSEEIQLSNKGFKDILSDMQDRCNGGASLVDQEFEQSFLSSVPDSIDPTRLNASKTVELRSAYFAAYKASANILTSKAELAKVLAKYQTLIDELKQNREQANNLQNIELPKNQKILENAQKQQAESAAEIARINSQIPGLTAKIEASQKAYDAARAILAPLEPEYNRITGDLNSAQASLSASQSRLNYIDTRLRDGAQEIYNLDYEATSIERRLPQKKSDLDRARTIFRDAQSRRVNFNVSWERDNRLRNHYEYARLHSDRQNMNNHLRQVEMDLQRARMERDRVARDLQNCRANPIIAESAANELLTPGNPGKPGGPGQVVPPRPPTPPPGPVTPPPQPPPRDCSHLERALNNANMQVSQKQNEHRNISLRINEISSRIYQIEQQVDMDVRREYDSLVYAEDQARREHDRIENDVNSDQNRLAQIRSSEIPRLEREQTQLQSERPSVLSQISESTAAVQRLTQELTSFKSSTDWDRKAAAVNTTGNQLNADQNALKIVLANKLEAQRRLEAGALTEAQTKAQIDSLNSQLAALNQRAAALDEGLKNLPAERAPIDAAIAAYQADFTARQNRFLDLLK